MAKRSKGSIVVSMGCPSPPYIKGGGEGRPRGGGAPKGGGLLPPGVGFLLFLFGEGEGRKRKEGGRKGGGLPIWIGLGGVRPL